jgi:hypothetical protein
MERLLHVKFISPDFLLVDDLLQIKIDGLRSWLEMKIAPGPDAGKAVYSGRIPRKVRNERHSTRSAESQQPICFLLQ